MKQEEKEIKIAGKNAVNALWKKNPSRIAKVYLLDSVANEFNEFLKWCSARRIAYKIVTNEDMANLTESTHHEGICVLAKDRYQISREELIKMLSKDSCVLYLDQVDNPHNIGAIMRSAAHFGVGAILGRDNLPKISPALARVSEGGIEYVPIFRSAESISIIKELKTLGYQIISTSSHRGESLFKIQLPKKCIFILGNEAKGVSPFLNELADKQVKISGTGDVESLNVSVSAALLMAEYYRLS